MAVALGEIIKGGDKQLNPLRKHMPETEATLRKSMAEVKQQTKLRYLTCVRVGEDRNLLLPH